METNELGKLSRVEDLRTIWKNEASDFTPWLVDNINLLGEALGIDIEVEERECGVGDFSLDILARDLGRNRRIVIENQLEKTDHTHLGQLITYAAGLEASIVVWISKEIREEHRQALDWLNRGDGATTEYFGVVVELLQIDESRPGVNLRVVASPNSWTRTPTKLVANDGEGSRYTLYQSFFQSLIDELRVTYHFTNARVGQPQNWYTFSSGTSGFVYGASFAQGGRIRAEVYIDFRDRGQNEAAFEYLRANITNPGFEEQLEWEALEERRACRVAIYRQGSIEDSTDRLEEYHRWMIDRLLRFKAVFGPMLPAAAKAARQTNQASV